MSDDDPLLLIEEICSVTAFDMKVQVSKDGRERGLWIFLRDHSPTRMLDEGALLEWDEMQKVYDAIGAELKKRKPRKQLAR